MSQVTAKSPATTTTPKSRSRLFGALNTGIVIGGLIVVSLVVLAVCATWVVPFSPDDGNLLQRLKPPSEEHLLGTDALGRDLFSRLVYGTRVSVVVGVGAVLAGAIVGIPLGLWAGYKQGRVDATVMRAMDLFLSVPKIVMAIIIMSVAGAGMRNLIFAIGVWNVPVFARITRSTTLSLREREFVTAAEAIGSGPSRVMFLHILPNAINELIVTASLSIASAIMVESGLSYLGLGVPPHVPSWGMILSEGRPYLRSAAHVTTYAGLFIMLAVLGFNLLGDGLRDAFDPKRAGRVRRRGFGKFRS